MSSPIARYRDIEGDVWERYADGTAKLIYFSDGQPGPADNSHDWDYVADYYEPVLLEEISQPQTPEHLTVEDFATLAAALLDNMATKALARAQESEDHIEREISYELAALFQSTARELREPDDGDD